MPATAIRREEEEAKEAAKEVEAKQVSIDAGLETEKDPEKADGELKAEEQVAPNKLLGFLIAAKKAALHGVTADIHEIVETDEVVAAIHANAEVFDPKAEAVFSYMQARESRQLILHEASLWNPSFPYFVCGAERLAMMRQAERIHASRARRSSPLSALSSPTAPARWATCPGLWARSSRSSAPERARPA